MEERGEEEGGGRRAERGGRARKGSCAPTEVLKSERLSAQLNMKEMTTSVLAVFV